MAGPGLAAAALAWFPKLLRAHLCSFPCLQADGLAWELMDEAGPGPGFPQGGLSHLGCAPRRMLRAACLLCLLAFCCLAACGTRRQGLVGLGLWQNCGGSVRTQCPHAWLEQRSQSCWQGVPSAGQPCPALCRCQRRVSPALGSGSSPFPVLVAALPITQRRLHGVSPRNANCFGLRLVQRSHWAFRALSQLRDLPDPPSPAPGEPAEVCCGGC